MFPTHASRRQPRHQSNTTATFSQGSASHQTPITSSIQYPGHTVPGYAYPSKYSGMSANQATHIERVSHPQWTSPKIQGYDRDGSQAQDGNPNLDESSQHSQQSHHSYHSHSSTYEGDQQSQPYPVPQSQAPPQAQAQEVASRPDPYQRYQRYQYQQSPSQEGTSGDAALDDQSAHYSYPSTRSQSNRYYSHETPVDYQPYIPERGSRSVATVNQQKGTAPYNKWTPPARYQQFISTDSQPALSQHQEEQQQEEQSESHFLDEETHNETLNNQYSPTTAPSSFNGDQNGSHTVPIDRSVDRQPYPVTENGINEKKFYPGHPAYKWTPPAVLQVFQAPSPSLQCPQPSQPSSKYALHSHSTPHDATESIPVTVPPSHIPHQNWKDTTTVDHEFIEWAKLQPSQQVMIRLSQENIRGDMIRNQAGNSLLHSACEVGNLSLVYSLVEMYDAHPFSTFNQDGLLPVHVACQYNRAFIVSFFLKNKIVNGTELTADGMSFVHVAAQHNAVDVVAELLKALPPHILWTSNQQGLSPLHIAASEGNLQILQKFSTVANQEFSQADAGEGRTCLHWAAAHRHYHVIKFLLQMNKIDSAQVDRFGKTADQIHSDPVTHYLIYGSFPHQQTSQDNAVGTTQSNETQETNQTTEGVEEEAEESTIAEMSPEPVDIKPTTPTTVVVEKPIGKLNVKDNWIKKPVEEEKEEGKVNEEANQKAIANSTSTVATSHEAASNTTPHDPQKTLQLFDWVSVDNKISELENYLGVAPEMKVNINTIKHPITNESLLHTACRHGHLAVAQFLVEGVGSNVNTIDEINHATSLHEAVQYSHVLIVRYLVKYCGALLDIQNKNGKTALEISQEMESTDDQQEITKILSKAIGKSPEKRTKITLPVFHSIVNEAK